MGTARGVAELHVSQCNRDVPDGDVPYIAFESRENGPRKVSVLLGVDVLDSRTDELADDETWTRYLFPSSRSESPHVTRDTIGNRFRYLAAAAGLPERIDGERPSQQLCRRFWYDTYTAVLEGVEEIDASRVATILGSGCGTTSPTRGPAGCAANSREQLAAAFGETRDST